MLAKDVCTMISFSFPKYISCMHLRLTSIFVRYQYQRYPKTTLEKRKATCQQKLQGNMGHGGPSEGRPKANSYERPDSPESAPPRPRGRFTRERSVSPGSAPPRPRAFRLTREPSASPYRPSRGSSNG